MSGGQFILPNISEEKIEMLDSSGGIDKFNWVSTCGCLFMERLTRDTVTEYA